MKLADFKPSNRDLRGFGLIVGGIFLAIGLYPVVSAAPPHAWAVIVAAVLGLPALAWPPFLLWPYRVWMVVGLALSWINTRLILGILFFLVLLPAGLIRRTFSGRKHFPLAPDAHAETYAVPSRKRDAKHFDFQF